MGLDLTRRRDQKPLLGRGKVPQEVRDRLKGIDYQAEKAEEEHHVADVDLPKTREEVRARLREVGGKTTDTSKTSKTRPYYSNSSDQASINVMHHTNKNDCPGQTFGQWLDSSSLTRWSI